MHTDRYQRVKAVFTEVVDAPMDVRVRVLDERCADDADLRQEVESLLQHADAPAVNLEQAVVGVQSMLASLAGSHAGASAPRGRHAERIGGYRILGVLGEGGMGVVYVAEQERPRRTVALKVIKAGYVSPGMLRRFEHEAQVLGKLQHPGIAQIFEAGTADSGAGAQPYFAMEYVRGRPLMEYAAAHHLGTRQRLELLIKVSEAVQHAHSQGIIHRDLKPANILVLDESNDARVSAAPAPKILDFGVARSTDADVHTTTLRTDIGQLIGTIPYMSPEQVKGDTAALDARSDIYALGVIAYELLTGRLPHDLRGKTIPEAVRIIGENEPTPLSSINRFFRGDLDTIVSKSLEREPARRYSTASELAADIRRYLDDHPIVARPPSAVYQMRKFAKRHRAAVTAMVAVFLTLLTAMVVVSIYAVQATMARNQARSLQQSESEARELAMKNSARLAEQLAVSNIERGRLLGYSGNIREAEDLLWQEHLREPNSPLTHWALWELYSREPCVATIAAHDAAIFGNTFTVDGRWLVTSDNTGDVSVWDARTLEKQRTWKAHNAAVYALEVAPDSDTLVTGADDGTVSVWSIADGSRIDSLPRRRRAVRTVDWSPDGRTIALAGGEGVIWLWDRASRSIARELRGHQGLVHRVRFSPQGGTLASVGDDGLLCLWSEQAEAPVKLQAESATDVGRDIAALGHLVYSRDGRTIVTGGGDQLVKIWDVQTRACTATLNAPNGTVRFVALSPDGKTIYAGGWWHIERWDIQTGQRQKPLSIHSSPASGVLSPDGRQLVAGFQDGLLRAWEVAEDRGITRLGGHSGRAAAGYSADGRRIATGDSAGVLRLWDAHSGALQHEIAAHDDRIRTALFHPTQPVLFTSAADSTLRAWDVESGRLLREFTDHHSGANNAVCISRDGTLLAYTVNLNSVRIMTWPECETKHVLKGTGRETLGMCLSPDSSLLVLAMRDNLLVWFDARTGTRLATFTGDETPWSTAFNEDGSRLYSGTWGKIIEVWEPQRRERIGALVGHSGLVCDVRSRPLHARMLASSSLDGTARLWDTESGTCLATLKALDGWEAITTAFSPDGRRLVVAGRMADVVIIDLEHYDRFIAGNQAHHTRRLAQRTSAQTRPAS